MKRFLLLAATFVVGILGSFLNVCAQETVPCLIFTGNAEKEHLLDLAKVNRITFGDDAMVISDKDGVADPVTLLYSLYHHIEIGEGVPSFITGKEEMEIAGESNFLYDSAEKVLVLSSDSTLPFTIGIFNLQGVLVATSTLSAGQKLPVEALEGGTYIAIAANEDAKLTLKFLR